MFIEKVEITDVLSVKGTIRVDLDRRVSILLGSNDHGKTNILKAIEHLNDEREVSDDEVNWDAEPDTASIEFLMSLDVDEFRTWSALVKGLQERAESKTEHEDGPKAIDEAAGSEEDEDNEENETEEPTTSDETLTQEELAEFVKRLDPSNRTITLSRRRGSGLLFNGVEINTLPQEIASFIKTKKPRVEIFRTFSGNLQDSVTAKQINTEDYEFMQGVFFYAGLDPRQNDPIFTQNDSTMRKLDNASKTLDESLRKLWGQGTALRFELRHQQDTIQFLADDPAIQNRRGRMSKRSDGVTQFFRVAMTLHARRKKNPANSYVYLFDEPGVFLHPQGQKDLVQVFEQLADDTQLIYATHSLFMLNQNFPERHRLIYKDESGTKVDQKPHRANWKYATDALGVYLTANILFSSKILLVEGDSDPIYIYELFRQLNRLGDIDADSNPMAIMSFSDVQNLRFLLQTFKKGEDRDPKVAVLVDGDDAGQRFLERTKQLCKRLQVEAWSLPKNQSIEDFCLFEDQFLDAAARTLTEAFTAEGKDLPSDLPGTIKKSWEEHKQDQKTSEKKRTAGKWFKDLCMSVMEDEVSKVGLARNYAYISRELSEVDLKKAKTAEARKVCERIISTLSIPNLRARQAVESSASVAAAS